MSDATDHSARERILAATVAAIDRGGEPAVRLVEVAREAGVTQGMISYYFAGREGLVTEAERQRFLGAVNEDAEVMLTITATSRTLEEYLEQLEGVTRVVLGEARSGNRRVRLSALGSAMSRPELLADIALLQQSLTDQMTEAVVVGQRRGFIRHDLDARAVASFTMAYAFGLALVDLDPDRPDEDELTTVIMGWVESIVPPEAPGADRVTDG